MSGSRVMGSVSRAKEARRFRIWFNAVKFTLLIFASILWIHRTYLNNLRSTFPVSTSPISAFAPDISVISQPLISSQDLILPSSQQAVKDDEADSLIRRAYERTYAHIIPCDDNVTGLDCLQKTIDYFRPRRRKVKVHADHYSTSYQDEEHVLNSLGEEETGIPSIPWWFQTFLRDLPKNGAFGGWHHMSSSNPPLQFCSIAKVGTTEWRNVFCNLNYDRNTNNVCTRNETNGEEYCTRLCEEWTTTRILPSETPRVVFIRDPLERLLSAYLNKCYDEFFRVEENHCEPNAIFNPKPSQVNLRDTTGEVEPLLEGVEDNDKQLFAAYLDVMPLKWNLHVVPQAFACDLYRNVKQYDFVGNMGKDFMLDLQRMANQFGGVLPQVLNASFGYQLYTSIGTKHVNIGTSDDYMGTQAPRKVNHFYTADTVRKALEYVSIDYVLLGLEVPEWARQMLREDES